MPMKFCLLNAVLCWCLLNTQLCVGVADTYQGQWYPRTFTWHVVHLLYDMHRCNTLLSWRLACVGVAGTYQGQWYSHTFTLYDMHITLCSLNACYVLVLTWHQVVCWCCRHVPGPVIFTYIYMTHGAVTVWHIYITLCLLDTGLCVGGPGTYQGQWHSRGVCWCWLNAVCVLVLT